MKGAYSYGQASNTVSPGSVAFGSWNNNQHAGNPNTPGIAFSQNFPGQRVFTALTYRRRFFGLGATGASLFFEGRTGGNASYTFTGDLNGDGGTSNDLIYIPRDVSEMNFEALTSSGRTFSIAEQAAAWEAFIQQDKYLSAHRGEYAKRGAVFLPMAYNADASFSQDISRAVRGRDNTLQLRLDILNVGNLLNEQWGVGRRLVTTSPLIARPADAAGRTRYQLRNIGTELISRSLEATAGANDVWRMQPGMRYLFD